MIKYDREMVVILVRRGSGRTGTEGTNRSSSGDMMGSVFSLTNSHEFRIVGKRGGERGPEHGAQNMPSRFSTAQHPGNITHKLTTPIKSVSPMAR